MRKCPLFDMQKALGAVFVAHAGFEVPAHYGDPRTEYAAATQSCVVVDLSFQGKLSVAGQSRVALLGRLLTGDVGGLAQGRGLLAMALTPAGRVLADVVVYALDGWHLLETAPQCAHRIAERLLAGGQENDVVVQDLTEAWGLLSLLGPECPQALAYLGIGTPAPGHIGSAALAGHPILVAERKRTSLPGYDLFASVPALTDCWNSILERGVLPAGIDAVDVLRVEAGIPWYGADLDERVTPHEAGMAERISEANESFVGREAVRRAGTRPPVRVLRGLVIEGDRVPSRGAPVFDNARQIGKVTSSVCSPRLGCPIALAYLRRGCGTGLAVYVDVDGERRPGKVADLPFMGGQQEKGHCGGEKGEEGG